MDPTLDVGRWIIYGEKVNKKLYPLLLKNHTKEQNVKESF